MAGGTGTLDYVAGSDGNYLGVIDAAVTALCADGTGYWLEVVLRQDGYEDRRKLPFRARHRTWT